MLVRYKNKLALQIYPSILNGHSNYRLFYAQDPFNVIN